MGCLNSSASAGAHRGFHAHDLVTIVADAATAMVFLKVVRDPLF
jgi:hypothetical protein